MRKALVLLEGAPPSREQFNLLMLSATIGSTMGRKREADAAMDEAFEVAAAAKFETEVTLEYCLLFAERAAARGQFDTAGGDATKPGTETGGQAIGT